jgi:hypothetical protein
MEIARLASHCGVGAGVYVGCATSVATPFISESLTTKTPSLMLLIQSPSTDYGTKVPVAVPLLTLCTSRAAKEVTL